MKFLFSGSAIAATLFVALCGPSIAQQPPAAVEASTLFQNVRVFDGKSGTTSGPTNVLVRGRTIARISSTPIVGDPNARTTVIAGNGRTLMPGLIDGHWHAMLVRPTAAAAISGDVGYINLMAGAEATDTLMRGFTTVRDLGGPVFGLKRAIDEGLVVGPRIYPSGAMISITGGHGDFRQPYEVPRVIGGPLSRMEQIGGNMITDSPDEVRVRVREQLLLGASQIKLTRWYTPAELLTMATGTNGELLRLSGPRNPYPGKLGVVEEGALADLLLVDGNPIENVRLIENPDRNFLVIMKDGKIYKNTLPG